MIRNHPRLVVTLALLGACTTTPSSNHATVANAVMSPDGKIDAECAALALDAIDQFRQENEAQVGSLEAQFQSLAQGWLDNHPQPKLPAAQQGSLDTTDAPDQMRGEEALSEAYTAYLDGDPVVRALRDEMAAALDRSNPANIYQSAYLWAQSQGDYQAAECLSILRDTPAAGTILDDSCYTSESEALEAEAAIVAAQAAALAAPDGRPNPNVPAFLAAAPPQGPDDPPFEDEPKKCVKPAPPVQPPPTDQPPKACPAPVIEFAKPTDDQIKVGCKAVIVLGTPDTGTVKSVFQAPVPESDDKKEWCEPLPKTEGENELKRTTDSLMKHTWSSASLGFAYSAFAGTFDNAMNKQQDKGVKRDMQGCNGTWPSEPSAHKIGGGIKVKPFIMYVPAQTFDPRKGKFVKNTSNLPAALTSRGKIVGPSCDPYVYAFSNFNINEDVSIVASSQMFTIPSRHNTEQNQNYLAHAESTIGCWSTANTGAADDPQVVTAEAKLNAEILKDCKVEVSESTTTSADISGNVGGQAGGKDGPMRSAGFGVTAGVSKTNGKAHTCQTKTWEADSWEEAVKAGESHSVLTRATASCKAVHGTPMRQAKAITTATSEQEVTVPGPDGQPKKSTVTVYKPMTFFGSSTLMAGFQLTDIQTKAATTWGNVNKRGWVCTFGYGCAFSYSYAGLSTLYHRPFIKGSGDKPEQKSFMSVMGTNCEVYHYQFNDFSKIWERVQTGVPLKTPPGGDNAKKEWPVAVPTDCEIAEPVKREYWMFKPVKENLTEQIPDPKF